MHASSDDRTVWRRRARADYRDGVGRCQATPRARSVADDDRGEAGGGEVPGGHALDVGRGDPGDARLEAVGIVEAEPLLLDGDQELGELLRGIEPQRKAPDEVGARELELARVDRRPPMAAISSFTSRIAGMTASIRVWSETMQDAP